MARIPQKSQWDLEVDEIMNKERQRLVRVLCQGQTNKQKNKWRRIKSNEINPPASLHIQTQITRLYNFTHTKRSEFQIYEFNCCGGGGGGGGVSARSNPTSIIAICCTFNNNCRIIEAACRHLPVSGVCITQYNIQLCYIVSFISINIYFTKYVQRFRLYSFLIILFFAVIFLSLALFIRHAAICVIQWG